MSRLTSSLRLRLIVLFSSLIFLLCFLFIQFYCRHAYSSAKKLVGERLACIAAVGATRIDGDLLATLRKPQDMDSPTYRRIKEILLEIRDAAGLWETYTIFKEGNILKFLVDADIDHPALLGEQVKVDPEMLTAFEAPSYNKDFTSDKWGVYLSGFAPVRDKKNYVVGILGVDARANKVAKSLSHLKKRAYVMSLAVFVASIVIGILMSNHITRPIHSLMEGLERVKGGEFGVRIKSKRPDELGKLVDSFNEMSQGLKEKEAIRHAFERYVPREIAHQIMKSPDSLSLDGERRRITILFGDIRGFTKLTQSMEPEDIVSILNRYFSDMVSIIFKYEGTLDKFIGDGLMAIFGAPVISGNEEQRAVRAALEIQQSSGELSTEFQDKYPDFPELSIGIGIHTGYAIVGNIGSKERMEYTAIGEVVNVASRLVDRAKKGQILLSKETLWPVRNIVEARPMMTQINEKDVEVYQVLDLIEKKGGQ